MLQIATNIFKNLSKIEKEEIKTAGKKFGKIEIHEYFQKGVGLEEIIKFIFDEFALKNLIEDVLLWDSFKSLLQKIFNIAITKSEIPTGIQIWIRDITNPAAINIAFSIKTLDDIQELLVSLRTKLDIEIFSVKKEQQKGKIFLVAFDKENNNWLIKIL
jgi:nitrate reductase NapAB chaperone NapD